MRLTIVLFLCFSAGLSWAQSLGQGPDESALYSQTKQLNQFFRRFNAEEAEDGQRLSENDPQYRDNAERQKYLRMLFDNETSNIDNATKREFAEDVIANNPQFLSFHGGEWFAEVITKFVWNGKEHALSMYMELEKENLGSKWIISHVYFEPFAKAIAPKNENKKFLHPMSHEIDFMNLNKVFRAIENIGDYTAKDYSPDHLSMFLYEAGKGNLKFKSVSEVKFHFFQVDQWYFEVSDFNRSGYNTGWLISNLVKTEGEDKELLKRYIYNQE